MTHSTTPPSPTRQAYITQNLTPSRPSDEKSCPICIETWSSSPIIRTHCNHVFHRDCFLAWLGNEDVNSANSCPSCRAVCFPKDEEHQKESGLTLDMSFLYETMRRDYVVHLPVPKRRETRVIDDETMVRLAFGEDEDVH